MAKSKLFEFVVLHHPKPMKATDGSEKQEKSSILTDVQRVLAGTDKEVSILAARSIPEAYLDKLDEVEIIVRPFS